MAGAGVIARRLRGEDARVVAVVGGGHFFSHFYGIVLPPLFPLLAAEFGVGYAALGLLLTVENLATTLCQTPVGFLVDRFGARRLLLVGLGTMSAAVALMGVAPGYAALLALMAVAGVGNSVFHPADYAILAGRVAPARLGRAFSLHTFAGHVGWALAPAVIVALTAVLGWRGALFAAGLCGLAGLAVMASQGRVLDAEAPPARRATPSPSEKPGSGERRRLLLSPPMLLFFGYMALAALASGGLNGFTVAVLVDQRGAALTEANGALTALLVAGALGVLLGGQLADRTRRHDLVITGGFLAAAAVLAAVSAFVLPLGAVIVALAGVGLMLGAIRPSRDMMVRAAAPAGTVGRVFGFVTTGMNVGGAAAPLLFGWLIDRGQGTLVFVAAGGCMLLALAAALLGNRRALMEREAAT
jgi:MFS family permease